MYWSVKWFQLNHRFFAFPRALGLRNSYSFVTADERKGRCGVRVKRIFPRGESVCKNMRAKNALKHVHLHMPKANAQNYRIVRIFTETFWNRCYPRAKPLGMRDEPISVFVALTHPVLSRISSSRRAACIVLICSISTRSKRTPNYRKLLSQQLMLNSSILKNSWKLKFFGTCTKYSRIFPRSFTQWIRGV